MGIDRATRGVLALRTVLARLQDRSIAPPAATRTPAPRTPFEAASGTYTQPDATTCGSAVLVMAEMLADPAYATFVATGRHPATGRTSQLSPAELFHAESLAMHRQTGRWRDRAGRLQSPWISALGTSPWGLARQLTLATAHPHRVDLVDPGRPGAAYDRILGAVRAGHPVPLYVGNAWSPRHVVLVTTASADALRVYEPAAGRAVTVTRSAFEHGDVALAGWHEPWLAVVPS
ncbi:hypothetical protein GEV29_09505 [Aeromicrobium sp. SMF47]|uniref:hypothetical protein n=1 Tax=Aeromicrobium yanjiei TaxID=2662028 RepID=UPI00129E2626|nr:hypothetical protein [Aeromicrobium yanjiei]MRJ76772.1 hypothetical protein [Aeromicrobium yanjiei]